VGGLCGFFVFWLLRKIHDDDLMVKETWVLWLAAIVSVVVGAGTAFITNYINQDVWTLEANGLALFIAAFSASTGGVAAGLLTGIYKTSVANAAGDGSGGANSGGGGTEPSAGAHA
jgi:putative flippase GtrA